jgi:hypothetical protein
VRRELPSDVHYHHDDIESPCLGNCTHGDSIAKPCTIIMIRTQAAAEIPLCFCSAVDVGAPPDDVDGRHERSAAD